MAYSYTDAKPKTQRFEHFFVTFPHEHVLQVTLNRPDQLNCVDLATSKEIQGVWQYFDRDEKLRVGIITGVGRAFCVGADLKEWNKMNQAGIFNIMAAPGLAGLPRRDGKKPIIAAVNGICAGGGLEMISNCDIVVASFQAIFSLPEVKWGVAPVAGCLPRLCRTLGLQRTTHLALTGQGVSAKTLYDWGLVTEVVDSQSPTAVARAALKIAQSICNNSPDAVIVARKGIQLGWEQGSVEGAVSTLADVWYPGLVEGHNFKEGIQAFVERRQPRWIGSKL